jgi:hypothetical protein
VVRGGTWGHLRLPRSGRCRQCVRWCWRVRCSVQRHRQPALDLQHGISGDVIPSTGWKRPGACGTGYIRRVVGVAGVKRIPGGFSSPPPPHTHLHTPSFSCGLAAQISPAAEARRSVVHSSFVSLFEQAWTFVTGVAVETSPVISAPGIVLFGGDDGVLYAIQALGGLHCAELSSMARAAACTVAFAP